MVLSLETDTWSMGTSLRQSQHIKGAPLYLRQTSPMAITGSTAQELVEPTLALTKTGVRPATTSFLIAAARSSASMA